MRMERVVEKIAATGKIMDRNIALQGQNEH